MLHTYAYPKLDALASAHPIREQPPEYLLEDNPPGQLKQKVSMNQ